MANNWKELWLKGMEAIGNAANTIASTTQSKVNEMNLTNRRREILDDFGQLAYEEWQNGALFPPKMQELLEELNGLEEQLNEIKAAKEAKLAAKKQNVYVELDHTAEEHSAQPTEEPEKDDHVEEQSGGLFGRFLNKAENAAEKLAKAIPAEKIEEKTQGALNSLERAFDRVTDAVENSIESFKKAANEEEDEAEAEEAAETVYGEEDAEEAATDEAEAPAEPADRATDMEELFDGEPVEDVKPAMDEVPVIIVEEPEEEKPAE